MLCRAAYYLTLNAFEVCKIFFFYLLVSEYGKYEYHGFSDYRALVKLSVKTSIKKIVIK